MRLILPYDEFREIVDPYLEVFRENLILSFEDMVNVKRNYADQQGMLLSMTRCSMGSLTNNFFRARSNVSHAGDPRIKIIEEPIFKIGIDEKISIRWNKVDNAHIPSTQKTKSFKRHINQSDAIPGMPDQAMIIWGGYIPDSSWSKIVHQYLSFFNGELEWYHDYSTDTVVQLRLDKQVLSDSMVSAKSGGKNLDQKTGT